MTGAELFSGKKVVLFGVPGCVCGIVGWLAEWLLAWLVGWLR